MAIIDILPLAIGGVKPPLNLLYDLIKNVNPKNLFYPIDLAANPNYGHAVIFTVKDYNYQIAKNFENLTKGGGFNADFLNVQSIKAKATQDILSTISLYMPDTLAVTYDHDYTQTSLTDAFGLASFLGSAIADLPTAMRGTEADKGAWMNLVAKGFGAQGLGAILGKDIGTIAGNVLKQVPNPHLQLLYKGVNLREFQFEFIFTPTSQKEAQVVDEIIKTFTYYSSPALLGAQSHQYLEPPQIFNIKFAFTGGTGLSGAITNFFKNIGTNILTNQVSAALFGSNQNLGTANTAKIFEIYHDCVLTNINVDYAPNGWAAFGDGHPVQTRMTLQFKEMDIVTKGDISGMSKVNQYSQKELLDVAGSNPDSNIAKDLFKGKGSTLSGLGGSLYKDLTG